jgi:arylsulfatase A-like enzyme
MESKAMKRPNIIFIMSDDHATQAVSAYGSKINKTPNIDRIAKSGAQLNSAFCTNSICAPSRASILTGTYNHVNKVRTIWEDLDNTRPTFVSDLKQAGYKTALFGKWHLGHGEKADPKSFDRWEVLPGQGDYIDPQFITPEGEVVHKGYVTNIITDLALDWLDGLKGDEPFCLLVHHKAPHLPWVSDEKHKVLYVDEDVPEPDTLHEDLSDRPDGVKNARMNIYRHMPKSVVKLKTGGIAPEMTQLEGQSWGYQLYIKDYLRCVASIDDNTGRILDYLDEKGLTEDTLIVYTSDQGFFLGEHSWFDKRYMYDESVRMPLLISYPRAIEAGTIIDDIVTNVDFAQTLCDFAQAEVHDGVQGRTFRSLLEKKPTENWPTSMYYRYWEHDDPFHAACAHYGIRTHDYKLICYYSDGMGLEATGGANYPIEWELFDLKKDPGEMTNRYFDPEYLEIREDLKIQLSKLQGQVGDEPYHPGQLAEGLRPKGLEFDYLKDIL